MKVLKKLLLQNLLHYPQPVKITIRVSINPDQSLLNGNRMTLKKGIIDWNYI